MKEMTINGKRILLVEVPEGAHDIVPTTYDGDKIVFIMQDSFYEIELPTESRFEFLFDEPLHPTEEEAAGVVGLAKGYGFRNYQCEDYSGGSSPFDVWAAYNLKSSVDSWNSFATSHGFTPSKVVGLIDKNK